MHATEEMFESNRVPCDRPIHRRVQIEWIWIVPYLLHRHWPSPCYTR